MFSNADQSRYRVWDYPIKEQYTHIFKTIKASGMVTSASQGFQKVLEDEKATFAFIHDASQVLKPESSRLHDLLFFSGPL